VTAVTIALLVATVVLAILAAGLSALETALSLARESRRQRESSSGDANRERWQHSITALHDALLLAGGANLLLAAAALYGVLGPLRDLGLTPWLGAMLVFGTGFLIIEILPKHLALRSPESVLRAGLPVFDAVRKLLTPVLRPISRLSDRAVAFLSPKRLKPRHGLVIEEVETLIEMREEQRAISATDADVLQEIISLHSQTVKDCMTPRVDLPLMPHDADDAEAAPMLEGARVRHVPVFDEKTDAITAMVDTDSWRLAQRPSWRSIARQPVFVPETMLALDALRRHLPDDASAVVIVDEYGGFEGLMTRRNLVERLFGKVAPSRSSESSITSVGGGRFLISGAARVDEINRELDASLDAAGIDTIGGLVFNHLGYLPRPGERLEIGGLQIKVKRIGRNRIQQIEAKPIAVKEDEP
jgi:CBS domain containing-hemolysin-like protein